MKLRVRTAGRRALLAGVTSAVLVVATGAGARAAAPAEPALTAPQGVRVTAYTTRVELSWAPVTGATSYLVKRDGMSFATRESRFTDAAVSPGQRYSYTVVAVQGGVIRESDPIIASTSGNGSDRALLPTAQGPAECGRAGGWFDQRLVCNVLTAKGWRSVVTPTTVDWGYPWLRGWIAGKDGTVSHCGAVGVGTQLRCDTFDGVSWRASRSPQVDLGYRSQEQVLLPTAAGPAQCGLAGESADQRLICNVMSATGWRSVMTPAGADWGYPWLRGWIAGRDGTVSYCGAVGDGTALRCDTFDGVSWRASVSPKTDLGYRPEQQALLPTAAGPAECGRAGGRSDQRLVCTVRTATGWRTVATPYAGDWGYPWLRGWVAGRDGTVSYCGAVGVGSQLRCDTFDGATWRASESEPVDTGYRREQQVFLPTSAGPAQCARAGGWEDQRLICTVQTVTGWRSVMTPTRSDWGYSWLRGWVPNVDGTVSYCGAVGSGARLRCDTFDGAVWKAAESETVDLGYAD